MNRTIPDESGRVHGWISEPSGRGTASLLYTCLITIFLCAWSAMHTPIPARHTSWMENFFYKVGFAAFTIIAPEIVFLEAIRSYFFVRETLDELSASLLEGGFKYTEAHVWFIFMGGFEIQCTDANHRLNLNEIKDLITRKVIPASSIAITEEEISGRSKTDQLSKLITCVQILWFIIQLTGRAVQHLPTTNLELFTLGIVVCSLGTYAAFWRRPQDIHLPVNISVGEGKALRDVFGKSVSVRSRVPWHIECEGSKKDFLPLCLFVVITGIFGACHLIGWDFLYPSSVEQLLWRIFSISCMVIPFLILFLARAPKYFDFPSSVGEHFGNLLFLYALARAYLLVAIFISLRSVPAGVYETVNWSLYFPHL
ncbi:hypothetical protein V8E54_006610 [Elaphomyces granulatus]